MHLRVALAALAAAGVIGALLAACSADGPTTSERARPAVVREATAAELRSCRRELQGKRVQIACPTLLPTPGGFERPRQFGHGACESLLNFEPAGARLRSGSVFHLLVGARCGPVSLATVRQRWPVDVTLRPDLRLIGNRSALPGGRESAAVRLTVLRRTEINGRPALILRNPSYPDGGIHGGHLTVLVSTSTTYAVTGHPPIPADLQDEAGELLPTALKSATEVLPHEQKAIAQLLKVAASLTAE